MVIDQKLIMPQTLVVHDIEIGHLAWIHHMCLSQGALMMDTGWHNLRLVLASKFSKKFVLKVRMLSISATFVIKML